MTVLLPSLTVTASAANERALYLYYTHTGETARIVFKRDGRYVQAGLVQLNQFLRDWRHNEPAKMDPALFDLVWEVYQEVGATQPINVVSAYRNPATNASLRSRPGSGVAENSQHIKGHAMDFFIPGISLTKLRAVAMRKQVGGVGFYPTSGSPFVHLDTGNVRAWPRMTKAQLQQIFPDGKTLHLPTDGKPLSQSGRDYAMAQWQQCHTVPCNGRPSYSETQVASTGGSGKSLVDMFFGNGDQPSAAQAPATAPATMQTASVSPAEVAAPMPMMRPAALGVTADLAQAEQPPVLPFSTTGSAPLDDGELMTANAAPMPAMKSQALLMATAAALPAGNSETAVTAIAALTAPIPQPRLQMSNPPAEMLTAYAPALTQDPDSQRALQMIIERSTTASAPPPSPKAQIAVLPPLPGTAMGLRTASLGAQSAPANALVGLFEGTFGAVGKQPEDAPMATALAAVASRSTGSGMREVDLIAPDLEHVAEVFLAPVVMTSDHFAEITDHDEADFDPTPEMGRYTAVLTVGSIPAEFSSTRFEPARLPVIAFN